MLENNMENNLYIDDALIEKAKFVRQENFSNEITFVYPQMTAPVSVTGENCDLDCAHCGGHYLRHMKSIDQIEDYSSCLISGGCDHSGKVPVLEQKSRLEALSQKIKLNMHVGLVNEEEAKSIGKITQTVSFDFVACNQTIANVYGFKDITYQDYLKSYQLLENYTKVIPHICIGLNGGEDSGENRALELLQNENPTALAFIVFIPTRDTKFSNRKPPKLEYVVEILMKARIMFPDTPIHLGCMRPGGKYRNDLDYWAILAGINKIVIPAPWARELAVQKNYRIIREEECCSL